LFPLLTPFLQISRNVSVSSGSFSWSIPDRIKLRLSNCRLKPQFPCSRREPF
jgi:hypothetical protein